MSKFVVVINTSVANVIALAFRAKFSIQFQAAYLIQDRFQDQSAGFDLSPVRDPQKSTVEEEQKKETKSFEGKPNISHDTLSTTNPDYSQEKDMAYYLAKIKAKAAQKSQELRFEVGCVAV